MKYKHIVFDIDGTLVDTEYAVLKSFQQTLQSVTGKETEMEELKFCLGIPGKDALIRMNISDVSDTIRLWEDNMYKLYDTVKVFDGIRELLQKLTDAGCQLGIVTSKTREQFSYDFHKYGIDQFFGTVICVNDTTEHKPKPGPLLKYMELTDTKPEEVLYVGDSEHDLQCAAGAGADFALAVWGTNLPKDTKAEYLPETPLELFDMI